MRGKVKRFSWTKLDLLQNKAQVVDDDFLQSQQAHSVIGYLARLRKN